jgi:peptidyl-prolyl cis-trans isomerase A (cyclophilin A)
MSRRQSTFLVVCWAALQTLLLTGCSKSGEQPKTAEEKAPAAPSQPAEQPKPGPEAPATFKVHFDTSKGPIVIEVHREWAPIGADHFYELVKSGYYDGARFFRVVPNFVVQFGLAGDPAVTKKWDKPIPDDPVLQTNRVGSIVYATAGPNTRTTQLFINLRSNQMLDGQGFAPFGIVLDDGMKVVEQIYAGYDERPDQGAITSQGNAYLNPNFPKLDYIRKATIES